MSSVFSVVVLITYMKTFRAMASAASDPRSALDTLRNPSPLVHSVLALMILIVAAVLAIYKLRGMTRYGWRKKHEERNASATAGPA